MGVMAIPRGRNQERPYNVHFLASMASEIRMDELEERRIVIPLLLRRIVELEAENGRLANELRDLRARVS
jgi:hypothetical protein